MPRGSASQAPGRQGPFRRKRGWAAELVVGVGLGLLGALGCLLQLFWGQDIGLADNGDGFRLMCHFKLAKSVDVLANPLVLHYDFRPDAGCLPELSYLSSQEWLVRPAVWASRLQGRSGFDLRHLAPVHSALFGFLLAALYLALPGRRSARVVTTVLAGFLLADVTFVTYFVSPFSEPATFLGLLAVVAAAAWYVRARRVPALAMLLLAGAAAFLALAKSQTSVFALLVPPVLLARTVEAGPLRGPLRGRIMPAAACLVLLVTAGASLLQRPDFFGHVNKHNLVFHTLLVDSRNPEATLRSLGASPRLVRYRGTGYFDPAAAGKGEDAEYLQFQRTVSRRDLLAYMATRPRHWWPLLRSGAEAVSQLRTPYLSNYPEARPADGLLAARPNPTERLLGAPGGLSWPLLPVVWLAVLAAGIFALVRRPSSARARALGAVWYLLGATALTQLLVALLGDGYYELVKHTVLAGYATALMVAVAAGPLLAGLGRRVVSRLTP